MTDRRVLTEAQLLDVLTAGLLNAPQDAKRKLGLRGPERSSKEIAIFIVAAFKRGELEVTGPVREPFRQPVSGLIDTVTGKAVGSQVQSDPMA